MKVTVRAISVEWKKQASVLTKKDTAHWEHKDLGKMKGGEQPHHRATLRNWNTKMRRAEAEMERQTVKPRGTL